MEVSHSKLESMVGGWFVGAFEPTAYKTDQVEVAVKRYKAGATEPRHVHKVATEITLVLEGLVLLNGISYKDGDIICLKPGVSSDFRAIWDTLLVVVKLPSIPGDKYLETN